MNARPPRPGPTMKTIGSAGVAVTLILMTIGYAASL